MSTNLSVSSFFRFYIFNCSDQTLTKDEQQTAKYVSIAIGILTAGLIYLITFLAFYDRNFKKVTTGDPRIDTIRQNTLGPVPVNPHVPSLSSMAPPLPSLAQPVATNILTDKNLPQACSGLSLDQAAFEWNVRSIKMWLQLDDTQRRKLMEDRLKSLSKDERAQLDFALKNKTDKVKYLSHTCTANFMALEENQFLTNIERFKTKMERITPQASLSLWNIVPTDSKNLKKLLDQQLSSFSLPHKWDANNKAFITRAMVDKLGIELSGAEFAFAQEYFEQRLNVFEKEMQLMNRLKVDDVADRVEEWPLKALTQDLTQTGLRGSLMTPAELIDLTVEQFLSGSDADIAVLCERFYANQEQLLIQGKFTPGVPGKSSPEDEIAAITSANLAQARLAALIFVNGKQLEPMLPHLSPKLFSFLRADFVSGLSPDAIKSYFDLIFKNVGGMPLASNRIVRLNPEQIYHVMDELCDDSKGKLYAFLGPQQKKGLDKSKLTAEQCKKLRI